MVSRYCQDAGDWKGAIEFLLMAKRTADAFSLAKSHGQMDVFTKVDTAVPLSLVFLFCYIWQKKKQSVSVGFLRVA